MGTVHESPALFVSSNSTIGRRKTSLPQSRVMVPSMTRRLVERETSSSGRSPSMATSVSNGTSGNAHGSESPPPVAQTCATAPAPMPRRPPGSRRARRGVNVSSIVLGAAGAAAASARRPWRPLAVIGEHSPSGSPSLAVSGGSSAGGLSGAGGAQLLGLGHVAAGAQSLGLSGAGGAHWIDLSGVTSTPVGCTPHITGLLFVAGQLGSSSSSQTTMSSPLHGQMSSPPADGTGDLGDGGDSGMGPVATLQVLPQRQRRSSTLRNVETPSPATNAAFAPAFRPSSLSVVGTA